VRNLSNRPLPPPRHASVVAGEPMLSSALRRARRSGAPEALLFPLRLQQDPLLGRRLLAPRGLVPQPCFGRSENGQASPRACRTASADDACNWALARAASDRGPWGDWLPRCSACTKPCF